MDKNIFDKYFSVIESILFVAGEPVSLKELSSILNCDTSFVGDLMENFICEYSKACRGIKVIAIKDGFQLVTKEHNAQYIQKLLKTNSRQSLSQASLEVLSIVAYKQPITRIDIDEIRGVKSDRAVSTLVDKKLIRESGRLDVIGRPILYSTTDEFLRYFQLESLSQMPSLSEFEFDLAEKDDPTRGKEEEE